MKMFEVHVDGHTVVEVNARDEDDARARAAKIMESGTEELDWDYDISDVEDVTPDADDMEAQSDSDELNN